MNKIKYHGDTHMLSICILNIKAVKTQHSWYSYLRQRTSARISHLLCLALPCVASFLLSSFLLILIKIERAFWFLEGISILKTLYVHEKEKQKQTTT